MKAWKVYGKRIQTNGADEWEPEWEPIGKVQANDLKGARVEAEKLIDGAIWKPGEFFVAMI